MQTLKLTRAERRQVRRHVAFADRVGKWLVKAGVKNDKARATLAVGIADSLAASAVIRRRLNAMLATDPRSANGARRAGGLAVRAGVLMFDELLFHLEDMRRVWERHLENELYSRVPD